jgi:maltose alpha-D-glucosyltransferase/alpha-amylase
MIAIRKKCPALGRGTIAFFRPRNDKVLVYLRQYRDETLLMVHNLGGSAQAVELDLGKFAGAVPIELFGETRFPPIGERPYMLSLAPYGYYWFRLRLAPREEAIYGIEGSVI